MVLRRTNDQPADIAQKVLVTGGAGYIGSHINKFLSEAGYQTVILDDLSRGFERLVLWGDFYHGSIGDDRILRRVFEDNDIGCIIHLAGVAYVEESTHRPLDYWKKNVASTITLLSWAQEFGVRDIVFSSSCATYGVGSGIPITEDDEQFPINPYGQTKLAIEKMLKDLAAQDCINLAILRYFNAAGADPVGKIGEMHDPETHLIPLVLRACYNSAEKITIYGRGLPTKDGTCIRDYVHVTDLARAHVHALEKISQVKGTIECNLGLGKGVSVLDIVKSAEFVTGRQPTVVFADPRKGDPEFLVADCSRAKMLLGWNPEYQNIDDIVKTAWNWHEKIWNEQR